MGYIFRKRVRLGSIDQGPWLDERMMKILGSLGACLLALTACAPSSVAKDATYQSLDTLVSAVQTAGLKCEGGVQKFTDGSSEYRTCGANGWAAIYGSTAARDRQVKLQTGSTEAVMVVGPNWVVKAPLGDAKAVNEELGGTIQE